MELKCGAQNYLWGKLGKDSLVAQLLKSTNVKINSKLPYAELWMGCHPSNPSKIKANNHPLQDVIKKDPSVLGQKVIDSFGNQLPFLFKVLSINTALSIQAHPSKKLAEELHAKQPEIYKDSNYKPELAIALTPFEALCGFRPVCEIRSYLKAVPELNKLVSSTDISDDYELIKSSLRSLLQQPKEKVQEQVENLLVRISKIENETQKTFENVDLIKRLAEQFPGDVGIFMVYFLNYVKLAQGEAIFLAECEPHAYISGDCVECMACSDNVIRAGLTAKLIDTETLVSMLTYRCSTPDANIFWSNKEDNFTRVFRPPVPDFAVAHMKLPVCIRNYSLIERKTASIMIVTTGKGRFGDIDLLPGKVLFIPAGHKVTIMLQEYMEIFQAFVNV